VWKFCARKPRNFCCVCAVVLCRKFGVEVRDFGSSWRDGVAFSALIHGLRPELVDMSVLDQKSPRVNLERAFSIAEEHLGIPRLLDVEGMKCDAVVIPAHWHHSLIYIRVVKQLNNFFNRINYAINFFNHALITVLMHILFVIFFNLFMFYLQVDVIGPLLLNTSLLLVLITVLIRLITVTD